MLEQLDHIEILALAELDASHDEAALRAWYAAHLAKKSPLMTALGDLGKLPKEQRAEMGNTSAGGAHRLPMLGWRHKVYHSTSIEIAHKVNHFRSCIVFKFLK